MLGGYVKSHFHGAECYLHFWRQRADSDTFRNTCCPAFLLEVVGPHVRLSAVAWLDRVTIFPLTPWLDLLQPSYEPVTDHLVMPVARLLAAIRTGVQDLVNDQAAARVAGAQAAAVAAALRQPTAAFKTLPWPIRRDPRYDAAGALQLARYNPIYYVPLATGDDGVVVRLDRDGEYGLAAHQAWADLGLAPKVLRVESLPGGWHLVEMEWLPLPYEWQQLSMLRGTELDKALAVVQKQLAFAHSATGMVHGDMRPRNCLVRRDGKGSGSWQVRFIDFEWAGREGEATYPAGLNPEIPWPDDVAGGKQLRCAHDIELLATCAASLLAGDGQRPRGRGVVRSSLCSAARDRCTVPVRKAADVVLQRGVAVGWRQRAAAGWSRPAALGRRLAW